MTTIVWLSTSNVLTTHLNLALTITICSIMAQPVRCFQLIEYFNPSKKVERMARIDAEDYIAYNPLASLNSGEQRTFVWRVYDHYRFKGYTSAADTAEVVREYEPLLDAPNLFFDFAELFANSNHKTREESVLPSLHWIHTYGLLGLHPADEMYRLPGSNRRVPQEDFEKGNLNQYSRQITEKAKTQFFVEAYDDRGGPEETANLFRRESAWAHRALNLYKAALSKDVTKLEKILDLERTAQRMPGVGEYVEQLLKRSTASYVDVLVDIATRQVVTQVQSVLSKFAYPSLNFDLSDPWADQRRLQSPQSLTASLWPRNLLGAMYIQFYWMITSESDLSYCKHCGKPISHTPLMPGSGKRKPYKNKEFCSKPCRQNYHYHHRKKHKRQDS